VTPPPGKIVIPVAGLGTRMLPATKSVSKELLAVGNRPVFHYIAAEAAAAGATELILVAATRSPAALYYLRRDPALENRLAERGNEDALAAVRAIPCRQTKISVVVQKRPLGLGDAVLRAREAVGDSPFGVMLPDVLLHPPEQGMPRLAAHFARNGGSAVLAHEVAAGEVRHYGIVDCGGAVPEAGGSCRLQGVVEKPAPERAPSRLAVTGRYVFTPAIFDTLRATAPGAGGEVQLSDAIHALAGKEPVHALTHRAACYDCGGKPGLFRAHMEFALRDPEFGAAARDCILDLARGLERGPRDGPKRRPEKK